MATTKKAKKRRTTMLAEINKAVIQELRMRKKSATVLKQLWDMKKEVAPFKKNALGTEEDIEKNEDIEKVVTGILSGGNLNLT